MNTWLMVILVLVVGYIIGRKFPQLGAPFGM